MIKNKKIIKIFALSAASLILIATFTGCGKSGESNGSEGTPNEPPREIAERVDFSGMPATSENEFEYNTAYSLAVAGQAVSITNYIGESDIVVVPDTIEGFPVIGVRLQGTEECPRENIRAIKIPENVSVFMNYCINLTTVELPDKTETGVLSFDYCPNLTYINVPDGILSVGDLSFSVRNCGSLITL